VLLDTLRHRARQLRNGSTGAERCLWRHLRARQFEGFRFRRQVPIAGYIADFVCPQAKVIIELDGGQHSEQGEYDAARTNKLELHGYRVLRYWNHDVMQRTDAVLADILHELTKGVVHQATPP
jgi:very-short-patch-repair endonuclease